MEEEIDAVSGEEILQYFRVRIFSYSPSKVHDVGSDAALCCPFPLTFVSMSGKMSSIREIFPFGVRIFTNTERKSQKTKNSVFTGFHLLEEESKEKEKR